MTTSTALLLVDLQRDMLEAPEPVPDAARVRAAARALLERARAAGAIVVHVQNDGAAGELDEPHTPGWELVMSVADDEVVWRKAGEDAFADGRLAPLLRRAGVSRVVIAGTLSESCVQATALGAAHAGFGVVLASGAHATYDDGARTAAELARAAETTVAARGASVERWQDVRL